MTVFYSSLDQKQIQQHRGKTHQMEAFCIFVRLRGLVQRACQCTNSKPWTHKEKTKQIR